MSTIYRYALVITLTMGWCGVAFADGSSGAVQHTTTFQDMAIRTTGAGRDLIFIPGLSSSYQAFADICDAVKSAHRCHLVQLPGFAGQPPLDNVSEGFLEPVTAQLVAYIRESQLDRPVLVGHSLGGFVALLIASQYPDLVHGLVIVDSLPFLPAAQNPAATVEQMQPVAARMKSSMLAQSAEAYERRMPTQLMGMTRDQSRLDTLMEWGLASDRVTIAQAMYDMYTMDIRSHLDRVTAPAKVLGAWAAYESMGSTKEATLAIFEQQYRLLDNKSIHMSEAGYHFLMWDDPEWLINHLHTFLSES
ncbi:MAG: alpha/beta hydrolase [Cellvibrionaceae bacterium]